jgi:hypothetical protein
MQAIDAFDGMASLAKARELASDAARRCATLEAELADAKTKGPNALQWVRGEAATALTRLDVADTQRAEFEAAVQAQVAQTTRLTERLAPPRLKLKRLRDAQLVLHTLVVADNLVREVSEAVRSTADVPVPMATTSTIARAFLRLHALRACVREAADGAQAAADSAAAVTAGSALGAPAGGGGGEHDDADADGAVGLGAPLPSLLDLRVHQLQAPARAAASARLVRALGDLGWPGELKPRLASQAVEWAGATPGSPEGLRELRAALGEMVLLQYICDDGEDEGQPARESSSSSGGGGGGGDNDNGTGLWAIEVLLAPLLKRFRFHFETRRETNRRDKPEWVYSHVAGVLRMHATFLEHSLQQMVLSPVALL